MLVENSLDVTRFALAPTAPLSLKHRMLSNLTELLKVCRVLLPLPYDWLRQMGLQHPVDAMNRMLRRARLKTLAPQGLNRDVKTTFVVYSAPHQSIQVEATTTYAWP